MRLCTFYCFILPKKSIFPVRKQVKPIVLYCSERAKAVKWFAFLFRISPFIGYFWIKTVFRAAFLNRDAFVRLPGAVHSESIPCSFTKRGNDKHRHCKRSIYPIRRLSNLFFTQNTLSTCLKSICFFLHECLNVVQRLGCHFPELQHVR